MSRDIYPTRTGRLLCVLFALVLFVTVLMHPVTALAVSQPPAIDGNAAILVDARTGEVLYEQNADQPVAPASTTKIMTALLVAEAIDRGAIRLDDMVELTDAIMKNVPSDASRVGKAMIVGEKVSVRELLLMALMESDCVACDMLAVRVSGSVEGFVEQMNRRASQLGCRDTKFLNSHGYPMEGHTSTARSLYLITAEAAKHGVFMNAFSCLKYEMPATNSNDKRTLYSTDKLLYDPANIESTYCKYYNEYITGGKTGYSKASGNCLVSTAEKDGMQLISVITGVEMKYPDDQTVIDAFTETDKLVMWGFENYSSHQIVAAGQVIRQLDIENGEPDIIDAVCGESIYATLEKGVSPNNIQVTAVTGEEVIIAPVSAGDVMGTVSIVRDGKVLASADLLAGADAPVAPRRFQPNVPVIVILSLLIAAGAGFLVWYTNNNKILLLDLVKGKTGGSASQTKRPQSRAGAQSAAVRNIPAAKQTADDYDGYDEDEYDDDDYDDYEDYDEDDNEASNPFDEFFARSK